MLNYHPIGDVYHCIYRLLFLAVRSKTDELEWDRLRLMDFYFLFPHLLKNLKLGREFQAEKKIFKAIHNAYEDTTSPNRLFYQLKPIQDSAVKALIAKAYFKKDSFVSNSIVELELDTSQIFLASFDFKDEPEWLVPMLNVFLGLPLSTEKGLKSRSGVMEFRYDAN